MNNTLTLLNTAKEKAIIRKLISQFGITNKEFFKKHILLKNKKKKLFISTKTEKKSKLHIPRTERIGLYFGTINKDDTIRLSLEGTQIIAKSATKNILELNHDQAENWLKGYDFDLDVKKDGYYLLKYKQDFLGCGLIRKNQLYNFLPKTRRLKVLYE